MLSSMEMCEPAVVENGVAVVGVRTIVVVVVVKAMVSFPVAPELSCLTIAPIDLVPKSVLGIVSLVMITHGVSRFGLLA